MFGTHFFVFFEGDGKERMAQDFKELVEALLGEEAGVGRSLERPWLEPDEEETLRGQLASEDSGLEEPLHFAEAVFEFSALDECFGNGGEREAIRELEAAALEAEAREMETFEEEDPSLALFGEDLPPEWQNAAVTISFPPCALPAQTPEDRQASRPKAKRILRWLVRQGRRRKVKVHLGAGYFASAYYEPREVSPARLLTMAVELEEVSSVEHPPRPLPLDLDLGLEDPEACWEESKDDASWPARVWQRWIS